MVRICKPLLGLAVVLLTLLATGCGSSSGSSSESSSQGASSSAAAATTGPTVTTANKGFTAAQWTQYKSVAATFKALNTATINRVKLCAKPVNPPPGTVKKCVGNSVVNLGAATKALGSTLAGFANAVGGQCQASLGALINYVVPYEASIASVERTINTGNAAAVANSASSIQVGRAAGQQANAAVVKDCAP